MENAAPTGLANEDPGFPGEESILRIGPEMGGLRERMERPARAGRLILVMLGAVTASAGVAAWVTGNGVVGLAVAAFGGILLVLGVVQHLLYRRDQTHWPEQAFLWTNGLELVLHNGEVRGASWSDPDFGLQLVARRAAPPVGREYLLIWLADAAIPPVEITEAAFDRLRQVAADRALSIVQTRRGPRSSPTQIVTIQPRREVFAEPPKKSADAIETP